MFSSLSSPSSARLGFFRPAAWRAGPGGDASDPCEPLHPTDADDSADETPPREDGPFIGWFDSSHDLLNGLAVTEHGALEDLDFDEAAPADPDTAVQP